MIKKGYIAVLLLLFVMSCNEVQHPKKPDNFIKKNEMADILYDIAMLRTIKTFSMNEMRSLGIESDTFIYKKYQIDSLQFAENVSYYSVNFNEYIALWEQVSEKMTAQRDELKFKEIDEDSIRSAKFKQKQDSIKKMAKIKDSLLLNTEKPQDSLLAPIGD